MGPCRALAGMVVTKKIRFIEATFGHGVVHGVVISLLVLLPVLGTMSIFEKRGWNWVFNNLGYWVITLAVMGGILSAWR